MSNLHDNISQLAEILTDIKEAVNEKGGEIGDCTHPRAYGDAIRALPQTGGGSCHCDLSQYAKTTYVDERDNYILAQAKQYTDANMGSEGQVGKGYVDDHDAATLTAANAYTDSKVKAYADAGDAATLAAAKEYAKSLAYDEGAGATIEYVDTQDAKMLATALANDADILDAAKEYTDSKIPDVIDAVDPSSTALVQSNAIARALAAKQDLLTSDSKLFTLQQGDKAAVDVHYNDYIQIDAGGNTTVVQGNVYLVLVNDTKHIGVGDNGIYEGNPYTFRTDIQMKYGADNMTIDSVEFTSTNPSITGALASNKSYITWTIADGANLNKTVDITLTVKGKHSAFGTNQQTAKGVVQIVGIKSAEDGVSYDIDLNYGYVLGRLQDDGKTYSFTPNASSALLKAQVYKASGTSRELVGGTASGYTLKYCFDGNTETVATTFDNSTKTYTLPVATPEESNKFFHVYLYKDNVMWDHETLAIIKDGQKGDDAVSATELVLVNDTKFIGTGSDFVYNGTAIKFTTEATIQFGGQKLDFNTIDVTAAGGVTYTIKTIDAKTRQIEWTIPDGTNLKDSLQMKIAATGLYNGATKSAEGVVNIIGVKGGKDGESYDILTDYDFIIGSPTTDDGTNYAYTPEQVVCSIYHVDGDGRALATDTDLVVKYKLDNNTTLPIAVVGGHATVPVDDAKILTTSKSLTIELYKGSVLWDVETLGIIRDGAKGRPGDAGTGIKIMPDVTIVAESIASSEADLGETYNAAIGYTYPATTYVPANGDYLAALFNQNDTSTDKFEQVAVYKRDNQTWKAFPGSATIETGSTVVAPGTGHLLMWDGHRWIDVGAVTGGYIHQKFANEAMSATELANATTISYLPGNPKLIFTKDTTGTFPDGEIPGKYIGILVDNNSIASAALGDYKWTRWAGEDGFGMEQIFMLGKSDKTPDTPTYAKRTDSTVSQTKWYTYDYEPKVNDTAYGTAIQWQDHPLQPTQEDNCCYMSYRLLAVDAKKDWSEPMPYLFFAQDGKDVTTVHIQNDNITLLIDKDNNQTVCDDLEQCKIDLFIEGEKMTTGISNIRMSPAPTGFSIPAASIQADGKFQIKTAKSTNVAGVDSIQIDCTYGGETYTGYVSVTKLASGRSYNIDCNPTVIRQDGNDNSLDNLVEKDGKKGIEFVIVKELVNGNSTEITNAATHPDYEIRYKLKGAAEAVFTGATNFIEIADEAKPIEYISIYSNEGTNPNGTTKWVFNDKQSIYVVKDGADGMDSEMQEFVYLVQASELPAPNLFYKQGDITSTTYIEANESQYTYSGISYQTMDWLPFTGAKTPVQHWNDRASGVEQGQTEWYAVRYKEAGTIGTTKWGAFTEPKIWTRYGEDGRDGDGIEYIFCTTAGDTAPGIDQITGHRKGETAVTDPKVTPEWLPKITGTTAVQPADGFWSDNPLNVTKAYPIQWVSKRKYSYKAGSTTEKEWGQFATPTKWSVYADTNTVAQLDNDKIFVGTGDDLILNSKLDAITIKATLTNGGKACTKLKMMDVKQNGTSLTKSGTTYKDGVVSFACPVVVATAESFDITLTKAVGDLDLNNPRIYTFDLQGEIDGQTYNGSASFTITALKNAKDGVFYTVSITPNDFYVDAKGVYSGNLAEVRVIKTEGSNHEAVSAGTLTSSELYYYTDLDAAHVKVPSDGYIHVENLANQPNVLTVVFDKDGFYDSESAYIHREKKSIEKMDEIYGIFPVGETFDSSSTIDETKWGTTIAEAIGACPAITKLTELDDKGYNLWNATKVTYTDDTVDYIDFTNLGNGILNVIELYKVTNPNIVVDADWLAITGNKPTANPSASTAEDAIAQLVADGWSKQKPDSAAKFDCLWNVEFIVTEDNKYRVTDVALINQMVYGESAYALVVENQYPQISCDANGNVKKADFQSTATLMGGEKPITEDVAFTISAYGFTADSKNFYCIGQDATNYIYTNNDKSLVVSLAKDLAFAGNNTGVTIRRPSDGWSGSASANNFKKLNLSVNDGVAMITSPTDYAPEVEDCYTYIKATYPTSAAVADQLSFTNCIATHKVNTGASGVPYNFRGEWQPNTDYYSDETHIDLVYTLEGTTKKYWICKTEHTSNSTFNGDEQNKWTPFKGQYENLATGLLLAEEAVIGGLKVNAADVIGTLSADQIDVTSLSANEVHVTDSSKQEKVTIANIDVVTPIRYERYEVSQYKETVKGENGAGAYPLTYTTLATFTTTSAGAHVNIPDVVINCYVHNYDGNNGNNTIVNVDLIGPSGSSQEIKHASVVGNTGNNRIVEGSKYLVATTAGEYRIVVSGTANLNKKQWTGDCSKAVIDVTFKDAISISYDNQENDGVKIGPNGIAIKSGVDSIAMVIEPDGVKTSGLVRSDPINGVTNIKIISNESEATDTTGGTLYILIP